MIHHCMFVFVIQGYMSLTWILCYIFIYAFFKNDFFLLEKTGIVQWVKTLPNLIPITNVLVF